MKWQTRIYQDEDGVFIVECPTLPGCVSQGRTRAEALENITDAIRGYLESLAKAGDPIPPPTTEELVEVALP
jgi:antitoxin HicB